MQPAPTSESIDIAYTTSFGANVPPPFQRPAALAVPKDASVDEVIRQMEAEKGHSYEPWQRIGGYDYDILVLRSAQPMIEQPALRALGDHHEYLRLRVPKTMRDEKSAIIERKVA